MLTRQKKGVETVRKPERLETLWSHSRPLSVYQQTKEFSKTAEKREGGDRGKRNTDL